MFQAKIVDKYNINEEYVKFIKEVKDILLQHKKSPVEFVRKDAFVICDNDYKIKTLDVERIKDYLSKTKNFLREINQIITNNEKIFNEVVLKGNI